MGETFSPSDWFKMFGKKLLSSEGNRNALCQPLTTTLIHQPIQIVFIQQL